MSGLKNKSEKDLENLSKTSIFEKETGVACLCLQNSEGDMKGRYKRFRPNTVQHVYQRTVKGHLLFYSIKDYLVFYTIVSIVARRYGVQILGLCLMVDHFHLLCICQTKKQFSSFMRDATRWYALLFNKHYGKKGSIFTPRFGSASKVGDKKVRTAIAYLYNNPVERKICSRAEAYRWNFLAYAGKSHPFSEKKEETRPGSAYRRAVVAVQAQRRSGEPLNYAMLDRLMEPLSLFEKQRLTDVVIKEYEFIDYRATVSYYKDYRGMVTAINNNTGAEYDINEVFEPGSDRIYYRLMKEIDKLTPKADIRALLSEPEEKRRDIGRHLQLLARCSWRQIEKFLRL